MAPSRPSKSRYFKVHLSFCVYSKILMLTWHKLEPSPRQMHEFQPHSASSLLAAQTEHITWPTCTQQLHWLKMWEVDLMLYGQSKGSEPALSLSIGLTSCQSRRMSPSEAAVSVGWLQYRDVKKYLPCH